MLIKWPLFCSLLLILMKLSSQVELRPKRYDGHQVLRLHPKEQGHVDWIKNLHDNDDGVEFWRLSADVTGHSDMRIAPDVVDKFTGQLNDNNLNYTVIVDDLQRVIDETAPINETKRRQFDVANFDVTTYHPYQEIYAFLDHMAIKCGSECKVHIIGYSYEGRPLKVLQIGKSSDEKPAVWIDAGLHAREWIAPATAVFIINKLINERDSDPLIKFLVEHYTLYLMPLGNPDGYHYTWTADRLWRKTRSPNPSSSCVGTDPNRNWAFHWAGKGTSPNPCSENFHGPYAFSEAETEAMARFLWKLRKTLNVYLSLHSYGQFWLTPWGFTYTSPSDYVEMEDMGNVAAKAMKQHTGSQYHVGQSSRLLYLAAGGSDDWVKGVLGVKYAYTVELRDTGRHGFMLPASFIAETGQEILHALKTMAAEVHKLRFKQ